tara:strand:- start:555 stop:743 length:189 start_codon:yes stop_codon:yes gene_type:complete
MEINQLVFNYLNKPSEIPDNEIIEEFTSKEDGKVVSYPRKKRKLKQKDLFVGIDKKKTKKPN